VDVVSKVLSLVVYIFTKAWLYLPAELIFTKADRADQSLKRGHKFQEKLIIVESKNFPNLES
jgi:hypothetical protein